ncbi:MAG: hypothetical protein ACR2GH_02745 [Pseudonocardia sp.]
MTIRQLYYTSCQQGAEGIQGFQVNAASPGIDRAHVDTSLQLSLYRPSPTAPSIPTPAQLEELPVAVGYRSFDDYAVLFHSRYLGADFTGRQGNYFAHILVLDAPDLDLAGVLPVHAWKGRAWRWTPADGTELPVLSDVPRGRLEEWSPGAYLRGGHLPEFGRLLTAVQAGLRSRSGRIVLVAPTDEAVAQAVAVVTRSLSRTLATAVSFVTFTSAPGDVDVLIVGTSPDVSIPASPLGDQTVLRLGGGDSCGGDSRDEVSRYARVLEACWLRSDDEVDEAIALASSIRPAVEVAELDELSHLIELIVPDSPATVPDLDVLSALEFGLRRWPTGLRAPIWARVAHHVQHGPPVTDTSRWSDVLAAAGKQDMSPPPVLLHAYLTAVLTGIAENRLDPGSVWMPDRLTGPHERTALDWATDTLDRSPSLAVASSVLNTLARVRVGLPEPTMRHLVARVVVPCLVDPATAEDAQAELDRMAGSDRALPGLVCAELEHMLAQPHGFRRVAETLPVATAELLAPHTPRSSQCALVLDVVQARAGTGKRGPFSVLTSVFKSPALGSSPSDLQMFVDLLWPELPSAADAVRLCHAVRPDVLARTRVPAWLAGRLVADAQESGLNRDDGDLAEVLADSPIRESLGDELQTVLAVRWFAYLKRRPRRSGAETDVVRAVDSVGGVIPEIRKETLITVAVWLFDAPDALEHHALLDHALTDTQDPREFVGAYRVRLIEVLRNGKPAAAAAALPALASLGQHHPVIQKMLDDTAAMVLTGRSKRDLEGIARAIGSADRQLKPLLRHLGRKGPKSWPVWWDEWQKAHLRTSLMSRLIARRRTAKVVD